MFSLYLAGACFTNRADEVLKEIQPGFLIPQVEHIQIILFGRSIPSPVIRKTCRQRRDAARRAQYCRFGEALQHDPFRSDFK